MARRVLWFAILVAVLASGCAPKKELKMDPEPIPGDHLVKVHIPLTGGDMGTPDQLNKHVALEDVLEKAVEGVGEFDGSEVGGGEYTLWIYGDNGKKLAAVVRKALKGRKLPKGSKIVVRYGSVEDKSAREEIIKLP